MKKNEKKEKAKLYKSGLRLKTPRPAVFEDKRFENRSKAKQNLAKRTEEQ